MVDRRYSRCIIPRMVVGDNVVRVSRMGDKDDAGLLINGRQEEILKTQSGILRPGGTHIRSLWIGLLPLVFDFR